MNVPGLTDVLKFSYHHARSLPHAAQCFTSKLFFPTRRMPPHSAPHIAPRPTATIVPITSHHPHRRPGSVLPDRRHPSRRPGPNTARPRAILPVASLAPAPPALHRPPDHRPPAPATLASRREHFNISYSVMPFDMEDSAYIAYILACCFVIKCME